MSYSYGYPLSSGSVISVEHGSSYSFITLNGETWDVRANIPDSVWDKLSSDEKSEVVAFTEDAFREWLWSNQFE